MKIETIVQKNNSMARPKTGGRTKGTPNKVTATMREWLQDLIDENTELLKEDFKNLEPKDRMTFITQIMPYLVPKKQPEKEDLLPWGTGVPEIRFVD